MEGYKVGSHSTACLTSLHTYRGVSTWVSHLPGFIPSWASPLLPFLFLGLKAEEDLPTDAEDHPSARITCPEGANAYGSYCYYFIEDRMTWGEADVSENRNVRGGRYLKVETVNISNWLPKIGLVTYFPHHQPQFCPWWWLLFWIFQAETLMLSHSIIRNISSLSFFSNIP